MEIQPPEHNPINEQDSVMSNPTRNVNDHPQTMPAFQGSHGPSPREMSISALADRCMNEINNYRRGEPSNDIYGVELLRRALVQRDPLAWEMVQQLFNEIMLRWVRSHPMKKVACRYDSEENYVAQAFARFWQATVIQQGIGFSTMASALRYLRATLNATILDTLRAYARVREMPLPEHGEETELFTGDQEDSLALWEAIQTLIPDERQRRVAYLLFHCHLKPREIVHYCSDEFDEVQEIYRLRRNIFDRLLRNADYIRRRLDTRFP